LLPWTRTSPHGHCQATIPGEFTLPFPSKTVTLSQLWTADLVLVSCALRASIVDFHPGLLSVGSQNGLSVYTLILENDLLTWSKKWEARYSGACSFASITISPRSLGWQLHLSRNLHQRLHLLLLHLTYGTSRPAPVTY
jgi:hypothetical protein